MLSTDVLKKFPKVETVIYNLEVIRDYQLEDNATCKLPIYELKALLEFISTLSFEYIKLQARQEKLQGDENND